jgi:hypothetical protein
MSSFPLVVSPEIITLEDRTYAWKRYQHDIHHNFFLFYYSEMVWTNYKTQTDIKLYIKITTNLLFFEAASSQEESAHIAAQNIESEATRNAEIQSEKCNNNTEKSSSDNHSETGNTDSTNNSTKEIDINVTTELLMKMCRFFL